MGFKMPPTNKSSGDLGVSSALLQSGRTIIAGISLKANSVARIIIYDNTAASGKKAVDFGIDNTLMPSVFIPIPDVLCTSGAFVVVTGSTVEAIVYYR